MLDFVEVYSNKVEKITNGNPSPKITLCCFSYFVNIQDGNIKKIDTVSGFGMFLGRKKNPYY